VNSPDAQPVPVSEAQIAALVRVFYASARAHPDLGSLFESAVTDWDGHLTIVENFWSHVLLRTGRYRGHPYAVHVGLGIRREHFEQWLALLRLAAGQTLPPEASAHVIARAEQMSHSFRAGLFPFDPPQRGPHP